MERKKKLKNRYKQLAKIGDKVIDIQTRDIGIIKQIDNVCNLRDNNRSVNEYYVYWPKSKAWTRHDCYYLDTGQELVYGGSEIIHLTKAIMVLYG